MAQLLRQCQLCKKPQVGVDSGQVERTRHCFYGYRHVPRVSDGRHLHQYHLSHQHSDPMSPVQTRAANARSGTSKPLYLSLCRGGGTKCHKCFGVRREVDVDVPGMKNGIEFRHGPCSKQTPPLCVTEVPNCQSSFGRPGFYQINHEGKDLAH